MCEYEVQVAHSRYTSHDVDKQRLLPTSRCRVLAELLPERHVWREGAEDASGENGDLYLELERLEAELNDMPKALPGVNSIRADTLHRHWNC
jgi:hypothetical protein